VLPFFKRTAANAWFPNASVPLFPEQRDLVLPDHSTGAVILSDRPIGLMRDQIVAVLQLPRQSGIRVRVGILHLQRQRAEQLPVLVYLDDARRTGLHDHRRAVRQPLKSVHLDALADVPIGLRRVVLPDDLIRAGVHFHNALEGGLEQQVAVREAVEVVDVLDRVFPLDRAVRIHQRDPPGTVVSGEHRAPRLLRPHARPQRHRADQPDHQQQSHSVHNFPFAPSPDHTSRPSEARPIETVDPPPREPVPLLPSGRLRAPATDCASATKLQNEGACAARTPGVMKMWLELWREVVGST
jgi:hypothetical protein